MKCGFTCGLQGGPPKFYDVYRGVIDHPNPQHVNSMEGKCSNIDAASHSARYNVSIDMQQCRYANGAKILCRHECCAIRLIVSWEGILVVGYHSYPSVKRSTVPPSRSYSSRGKGKGQCESHPAQHYQSQQYNYEPVQQSVLGQRNDMVNDESNEGPMTIGPTIRALRPARKQPGISKTQLGSNPQHHSDHCGPPFWSRSQAAA